MEKTIKKSGDIEIEKQKFHQHKRPVSVKNIDINTIVLGYNRIRVLNISSATEMLKRLDLYVYFFQK